MNPATGPDPDRVAAAARAAAARAVEAALGRDFATFRCGCGEAASLRRAPSRVREAFRADVRAALRRALETAWPGVRHDPEGGDVVVEALPDELDAHVRFAPLLVAGRYRKLVRGLSQTVFFCRLCKGTGRSRGGACERCGGSGRVVPESVEDFVRPAIERAGRGDSSAFHGAGREDVDVRMLGDGRPFVVSVEAPRVRSPDLAGVAEAVAAASGGRVEVTGLRVVTRAAMRRITTEHGEKTYRAVVTPSDGGRLPPDAAERIASLAGRALAQRTPRRVDDRRADLVRARTVLGVRVEECAPDRALLVLRTEAGTYVKEFVTGDDGRTEPSVASVTGVACVCSELDVIGVGDDDT